MPPTALCFVLAGASIAFAQSELKQRSETSPQNNLIRVEPGTRILLNMINSVSTKQAQVGDRIYLETAFPVIASNRVVIPPGSWVTGTITEVRRPGRMKGRGALQVRFDSLTLPNGVTKTFRSDLGSLDGRSGETLEREKSQVKGPDNKGGDTRTVVGASAAGAAIGAMASGSAGGTVIGAGAGGAAGLLGVMVSRGPDAVLTKGSSVEMVLDRPLVFDPADLDFSHPMPRPGSSTAEPETQPTPKRSGGLGPHLPF
jgi:type IV secretion system protein VirB10